MVMATVFWLDYMMSRREGLNKLAGASLYVRNVKQR